jgi:hypothetical protein
MFPLIKNQDGSYDVDISSLKPLAWINETVKLKNQVSPISHERAGVVIYALSQELSSWDPTRELPEHHTENVQFLMQQLDMDSPIMEPFKGKDFSEWCGIIEENGFFHIPKSAIQKMFQAISDSVKSGNFSTIEN